MKAPIFIVGANRSGTTLLRLMLNAHPRIAIPEEIVYFGSIMAGVPIETWENPPLSRERYEAFVHHFVNETCKPLDGIDRESLKEQILSLPECDFRTPYKRVLEAWARSHGKVRWGEKTPGNLFYADVLYDMFPDARFIHMIRDPRAGVSSMMGTTFFPKDIVFNAMSRHKFMTQGREILETFTPAAHRMTLKYEDLVREPESTVRDLCDFLEESFYPEMLSFYKESSKYMKAEAAETFNKAATRPISIEQLEKWRSKLSTGEIAKIEAVCLREMMEFGYSLENHGLDLKNRIELLVKRVYWRLQEWRHRRIRHFTVKSPMLARFKSRIVRSRRS